MPDLRINADHFRMIEGGYKSEHRAGGWQVDISAWLIRLCFQRKAIVVALIDRVFTKEVEGFAIPLQRVARIFGGIDFRAFPSTPKHVNACTKFSTEIHRAHCLLQRI